MNQKDLVDIVASKTNVTKKDTQTVIKAALESIVEVVSAGEKVKLAGFGTFNRNLRKERDGRNPSTGEKIKIKQDYIAKFNAGKTFKTSVSAENYIFDN